MRILAVLAILATSGWCGYWFVGARALDRGIVTALDRVAEIAVADHSIHGFPNRFDVTLDAPVITTGAVQWSAPFVQFFALSYRLNHLIAVFAHDQRLVVSGHEALLHSEDLRASLVLEAGFDLPLDRVTVVGQQLELTLAGETYRADDVHAASRRLTDRTHELVLLLEGITPDPAALDRIDPDHNLPRQIDTLRLDAEAEMSHALDRRLLEGGDPSLERITLTGANLAWDGIDISAVGRLAPDRQGLLSGEFSLSVLGWRSLMQTARTAGLMPAEHDTLITMAMQGLVNAENANRLDAAFSVIEGAVYLGPILVGQIPPLY